MNEPLAKTYEEFFAAFEEQKVQEALHLLPPEKVIEAIKEKQDVLLLDVRTKQEQSIVGLTYKENLSLPMNIDCKAVPRQRETPSSRAGWRESRRLTLVDDYLSAETLPNG